MPKKFNGYTITIEYGKEGEHPILATVRNAYYPDDPAWTVGGNTIKAVLNKVADWVIRGELKAEG